MLDTIASDDGIGFRCGSIKEFHDQLAVGSAADARENIIESRYMLRDEFDELV